MSEVPTPVPTTAPERATLVLISRTDEGVPDDAQLARVLAGRDVEVILVAAPWQAGPRRRAIHARFEFAPGAPWGDVVAACAQAATGDRMVFVELPAVQSLARVGQLLDELDRADLVGARLLRLDGITLETAGGGFNSSHYAHALDAGAIASTLPEDRRPVLWVDRRAFAVRRAALLATGPPHASAGDVLAEADWGWRLSMAGHRAVCSPILIPIDEGVGPPRESPLEEEGRRVQAGIALLATMLETDSLHRALAQNPAAAGSLRAVHGAVRLLSRSPRASRRRRRRRAGATTPRLPRSSAVPSTSTAPHRWRASPVLGESPRGRAWRFSAPTSSARARRPRDPRPRERARAEREVRRADRRP